MSAPVSATASARAAAPAIELILIPFPVIQRLAQTVEVIDSTIVHNGNIFHLHLEKETEVLRVGGSLVKLYSEDYTVVQIDPNCTGTKRIHSLLIRLSQRSNQPSELNMRYRQFVCF